MTTTTASIVRPLFEGEQVLYVRTGETIFRQAEEARGVYVIHAGEIDLLFSERNQLRLLRTARAGQVLGLSPVLLHLPHDCTATARTEATLGFIEKLKLLETLDRHPDAWLRVLETLSQDVNSSYASMRTMKESRAVY